MNWEGFFTILVGVPLLLVYVMCVPVAGAVYFSDKFDSPVAVFIWLFISILIPIATLVGLETN